MNHPSSLHSPAINIFLLQILMFQFCLASLRMGDRNCALLRVFLLHLLPYFVAQCPIQQCVARPLPPLEEFSMQIRKAGTIQSPLCFLLLLFASAGKVAATPGCGLIVVSRGTHDASHKY